MPALFLQERAARILRLSANLGTNEMIREHDIVISVADNKLEALMHNYLERRRIQVRELHEALAANRFDEIEQAGHNLYGSGSAYGLPRLTNLGQRLESVALERDRRAITHLIAAIETYIGRLRIRRSR